MADRLISTRPLDILLLSAWCIERASTFVVGVTNLVGHFGTPKQLGR